MTVNIYNDTEVDAPILNMQAGSMINLLDVCLVNGYSEKEPAGWTKVYHENNIAVFRNNSTTGTGMHLWVDDTDTQYAQVKVMKTIIDFVSGSGEDVSPNIVNNSNQAVVYWHKASTNTPKRWTMVADDKTLYLNVSIYDVTSPEFISDYGIHIYGAGDFISYVPNDLHNYFVLGASSTYMYLTDTPIYDITGYSGQRKMFLGRDLTKNPNTSTHGLCFQSTVSGTHPIVSTYTGKRIATPFIILEDRTEIAYRGELRGILMPLFRTSMTWFQNYGKIDSDPSGPDYYMMSELGNYPKSGSIWAASILVKSANW